MQLEYFQMIDRINEVDLEAKIMRATSTLSPMKARCLKGIFPVTRWFPAY